MDLIEFFGYILLTVGAIKFCKALFHQIGTRLQTVERSTKKRNIRKFRDQSWQLSLHVIMTLIEIAIMYKTDWLYFYDRAAIFSQDEVHPWIRRLYLAQLAAWFYTAFSHRFLEAHHKDYYVMYSHHAVTILLIAISFRPRLINVGYLVLLAHDLSDISVDLLKMTNYLGFDCNSGLYAVEVIFTINLISWITFRLLWFPFYMVLGAYNYGPLCCTDALGEVTDYVEYGWMRLCTGLLAVLVCMHVWWFILFVRLAFRLLREDSHKVGADEYEGTSDSEVDRPVVMANKED
jgi:ceramide synthetase